MPAKEVTEVLALPRVFCIVSARDDLALIPALADAGISGFQVREKEYDDEALLALTRSVLAAARPRGATVVVNDRLDVALAAGADGVHLGAADVPVAVARRAAPDLLVGATCRSREAVVAAAEAGADYAGLGPVFVTASKAGLPAPLGTGTVADAAGVLPLFAIGGVDASVARSVVDAGAHGVAVIGGIWRQPDPVLAAKELVAELG